MSDFAVRLSRAVPFGMIAVGLAVGFSSLSIVRAERVNPNTSVSYSCKTGAACVEGSSTGSGTWGVYGVGTKDDGVRGVTSTASGGNGVSGLATGSSKSSNGIYGKSTNAAGIYGISTHSWGVEGVSSAGGGVYGLSTNNDGVYGLSTNSQGVYGVSTASAGVEGTSNTMGVLANSFDTTGSYSAVEAYAQEGKGPIFFGGNNVTLDSCFIDEDANLTCTGTISGSVVRTRHRNSTGRHVLSYASESASQTIEDVGTAKMSGGVANVQIDPDFASVIDHEWYYVFLTPLGDTRGLYVSMKTPTAFQVRETEHGRSSLEFDYRIVAHPLDGAGGRLPPAPAMRWPKPIRPQR
jgi:hypothetical protein